MADATNPVEALPIDIAYNKLAGKEERFHLRGWPQR